MKSVVIIFTLLLILSEVQAQRKVVCYWQAKINASLIVPNICTHVIYSFLGLDDQGGLTYLWRSEAQALRLISSLVGLRLNNSNLNVLASIQGYNDPIWSDVAANPEARLNFSQNILQFVQKTELNGIDIDWEYPNYAGDKPQDKENYILLLQQIKQTLGASYSVSAAIDTGSWRSGLSYDIPKIFASVDFVNVMTYDQHGSWESKTGIHAALYRSLLDNTVSNVNESVQFILKQEIDSDKLIMGIPTYGRAFTLADAANNGVGAATISGAGTKMFNQICQETKLGAYTYHWEETQKVPYAFNETFWIGYDDIRSIEKKAHYIINHQLGGAMFWSIDSDDYTGSCGSGKFPLIGSAYKLLSGLLDFSRDF